MNTKVEKVSRDTINVYTNFATVITENMSKLSSPNNLANYIFKWVNVTHIIWYNIISIAQIDGLRSSICANEIS